MSDVDNDNSDTDTRDVHDGGDVERDESAEDESALDDLITAVAWTGGENTAGNDLDDAGASESEKLLAGSSFSTSRDVIVIIPPKPSSRYEYASNSHSQKVRRPSAKAVDKNKEKFMDFESKILTSPRTLKIICGLITIVVILGIGILMVVLARALDMVDLYIIGILFVVGGSLFTLGFIYARCVYDKRSNIYSEPVVSYEKVQ